MDTGTPAHLNFEQHNAALPSAIILAAKPSTRIGGRPKALASLAGCSLLERVAEALRRAGLEDILVVTGYGRNDVEAHAEELGLSSIYDPRFNDGILSSFKAGLEEIQGRYPAALVTPVDAALVRSCSFHTMLEAWRHASTNPPAVIPTFSGCRGLPLLLPAAFFSGILAFSGEGGAYGYLSGLLPTRKRGRLLPAGRPPCGLAPKEAEKGRVLFVPVEDEGVVSDLGNPGSLSDAEILLAETAERTLPSLGEAWHMTCEAGISPAKKKHCIAVSLGAVRLANAMKEKGFGVSVFLAGVSGLIHDIFRQEPDHAMKAAAFLQRHGWQEAAFVVGSHTSLPLATLAGLGIEVRDGEFASPRNPAKDQEKRKMLENTALCVFLADKYAFNDTFVPLRRRFGVIRERYKGNKRAVAAIGRRWRIASGVERFFRATLEASPFDIVVRQGTSAMEERIMAVAGPFFYENSDRFDQDILESEPGFPHG